MVIVIISENQWIVIILISLLGGSHHQPAEARDRQRSESSFGRLAHCTFTMHTNPFLKRNLSVIEATAMLASVLLSNIFSE